MNNLKLRETMQSVAKFLVVVQVTSDGMSKNDGVALLNQKLTSKGTRGSSIFQNCEDVL